MRIFRYYVLIIILSLLPFFAVFSTSLLSHTHDGLVHLARIGAYFKALADFQIPVRWAGDLNFGYGMPLFNFIYQLPYAIASWFIFLGSSLVLAFKLTLLLSFILSGVFMFGLTNTLFGEIKKALVATIFYQFASFHLVELLIRGSFGEVYTYAFLPLVLWGLLLIFKKAKFRYFLLTSIGTALLIISHNAISLAFFIIAFVFIFVFAKTIKNYIFSLSSLLLGVLLSAFYWLPAIFEHKYTYGDLFMKNVYLEHFPPIANFFIPNFLNDVRLQTGGVSVQIGVLQTLAIALTAFILLTRKKETPLVKKILIFSLVTLLVAFFLILPFSKPLWANLPLLRQFQFPWRLLSVLVFTTSLMSVSFFHFKFFTRRWVYPLIIVLAIISTIYYWKPQLGLDKINEQDYWNFPLNTTYYGETDVIWGKGPAVGYPRQRVELIGGEGTIYKFKKKSNLQTFTVDAKTKIQLVDHTQYFPGWRVYVDNVPTPIEFQDQNWRGELTFYVEKGIHQIRVVFSESRLRLLADTLSIAGAVFLFSFGLLKLIRRKSI